jgi:hypothetical protein
MAKTSPTQRSLKFMRDQGYFCEVVEKTIPHTFIKKDLFGWIDLVAVRASGLVGIQTTTKANMPARLDKAKGNGPLVAWLLSQNTLECHGWRKIKGHWACDVRVMNMSDLVEVLEVDDLMAKQDGTTQEQ